MQFAIGVFRGILLPQADLVLVESRRYKSGDAEPHDKDVAVLRLIQ
jgi:hypothetical protein